MARWHEGSDVRREMPSNNYDSTFFLQGPGDPNSMNEEKEQVINFFQHTLPGLVFHPVEYVKVLCQLGYEPIPPRLGRSLFGRPRYVLANVFQYIKHIKRTDGFFGCFKGFLPTLLGNLTSAILSPKVYRALKISYSDTDDPPNIINDDEPKKEEYFKYAKREITLNGISLVISYPFRVVTIRMMASFVGREEGYQSMFKTIGSIYRESGITGFYNGIIPRLIGDLSCIGASIFFAYFVNKYIVKSKECRSLTFPTCMFFTNSVTYPFVVVSTCMAVNGSSLAAGNPPRMAIYQWWGMCYLDLLRNKQHKRGNSLLFRYLP